MKGHPLLSIYREPSERLWNKPHTEQLGAFSLRNRIILDNPGHNLIMILDKLPFIPFSLIVMHIQGRTVEGLDRESRLGYLFTYLSRRKNSARIKKEEQTQWLGKHLNFHIFVRSHFSCTTWLLPDLEWMYWWGFLFAFHKREWAEGLENHNLFKHSTVYLYKYYLNIFKNLEVEKMHGNLVCKC